MHECSVFHNVSSPNWTSPICVYGMLLSLVYDVFYWNWRSVLNLTCCYISVQFSSVQSLSCVRLFATPWTAAGQASLSITNSQSLPNYIYKGSKILPYSKADVCTCSIPRRINKQIRKSLISSTQIVIIWRQRLSFTYIPLPTIKKQIPICTMTYLQR